MAGLNLQTGLTGSVVGGMYNGSSAAAPTRTAVPEGPTTVAQAAYGMGAGPAGGGGTAGLHTIIIGGLALGLLFFMWWGLPR